MRLSCVRTGRDRLEEAGGEIVGCNMSKGFKKFVLDKAWLSEEERGPVGGFFREVLCSAGRRGAGRMLLLLFRADDVVANYVIVRRLEAELDVRVGKLDPGAIEAVGKARDRLRKATKEFEDMVADAGPPPELSFADSMKPILERADGVLEEAMAFETRKKKRGQKAV